MVGHRLGEGAAGEGPLGGRRAKISDNLSIPGRPATNVPVDADALGDELSVAEGPPAPAPSLIRIPAVEVERYECEQIQEASDTSSSSIEESLPSRSAAARIAADTRRELMTRASLG